VYVVWLVSDIDQEKLVTLKKQKEKGCFVRLTSHLHGLKVRGSGYRKGS